MRSNLAKLRTYQLNESRDGGISGLLSAYKYSTLFELVDGNMYKDLLVIGSYMAVLVYLLPTV